MPALIADTVCDSPSTQHVVFLLASCDYVSWPFTPDFRCCRYASCKF